MELPEAGAAGGWSYWRMEQLESGAARGLGYMEEAAGGGSRRCWRTLELLKDGVAGVWSCQRLELLEDVAAGGWSCWRLELVAGGSWSCWRIELLEAGATRGWSC